MWTSYLAIILYASAIPVIMAGHSLTGVVLAVLGGTMNFLHDRKIQHQRELEREGIVVLR